MTYGNGSSKNMQPLQRRFLGAFAKLRKANISFVTSVSACNKAALSERILMETDI